MPTISKIRFANVIYEQGLKRYHDEIFHFDTQNGAILLENGGGKTVFIQAALQAIIPHATVSNRNIKDTLYLEEGPAHIAIEWLLNERPRQYVVTAVTLYTKNNKIESLRYVYTYSERDKHSIDAIPFTKHEASMHYPASKDDMYLYYQSIVQETPMRAKLFPQSIKAFTDYLENSYSIIREEWENMIVMNSAEGGIEKVFQDCKGTQELFDRLLIPSVENADKHFDLFSMTDQFEKQRSNLKKYKQFNEKKTEYNAMQSRLNEYVESYHIYTEALINYEEEQRRTASYIEYLRQQQQINEQKVVVIGQRLQQLKDVQQQLLKREKALEIYVHMDRQHQLQQALAKTQNFLQDLKNQYKTAEHEKVSLQYALAAKKLQQVKETIVHKKQLLHQESEKEDVHDLQNELELLKGQWLFLLEERKNQLEKQLQQKKFEANQLNEQKQLLKEQQSHIQEKWLQASNNMATNKGRIEDRTKELKMLKRDLVANEKEQVNDLLNAWNIQVPQLERSIRAHEDRLKQLRQQERNQQTEQESFRRNKGQLDIQLSSLNEKINQQQKSEIAIKEELRMMLHQLNMNVSIYDRAASYTNQLEEKRMQLEAAYAEKLVLERKANRYLDDYGTQMQFFAEAYIAQQMQHWSQFSYIQTGVEYVQSLDEEIIEKSNYPFWSITLITTAEEKQALIDKVYVIADRLTTPIIVLSREEAKNFVQGEPFDDKWIVPSFWREHLEQDLFLKWKQNAMQEAKQLESERKLIEQKLNGVNRLVDKLTSFLNNYPYSYVSSLKEQHFEATEALQKTIYDLKQLEIKMEENNQLIHDVMYIYDQEKDTLQHLQYERIPKAQKYVQISKKLQPLKEQYEMDKLNESRLKQNSSQIEKQLEDLSRKWLDVQNEQRQVEQNIKHDILNHDIYLEKAALQACPTTLSEHELHLQVKRINNVLNQVSATIQDLHDQIAQQENIQADYERSLAQILEQYPTLDKNIALPIHPEERITMLQKELNRLQLEQQNPQQEAQKIEANLQQLNGKINTLRAQYGDELPLQTQSLSHLKTKLRDELQQNEQQQALTKVEYENVTQLIKKFSNADEKRRDKYFIHQLNKVKELHPLTKDQQMAFLYEFEKELHRLFTSLTEYLAEKNRQQQIIDKEKQQFREFCSTLQDQKLSKVTMDGIENRQTYQEMIEHQQLIRKTIQNAIQLADTAIQEYDKDQQQIIQYALQQLVRIRHNLLEIPKKTRIRTEGEMKYVFQFTIPEWEEQEAKETIRDYINWILDTLEQDKYRDEYGNEDATAVRNFLEKHLQTVPLLRQVLGNKKMQVKCRKVESERQISSNYYSWEQSNQWSGGESWSKNMALYLGILKFIAEKSGSVQNLKKSHTLILDNPFGKASSDHVLSPVFYIAEQLGFQMIALTAHAEGKFIADYFPVVYSCRLRSVRNASHQVVQKEQRLNKAFFADQQPEALHYVGEKSQLSLFEE